jgi:hypothetical protein
MTYESLQIDRKRSRFALLTDLAAGVSSKDGDKNTFLLDPCNFYKNQSFQTHPKYLREKNTFLSW